MSPETTNDVLNRLLVILYRSFPRYLKYATPRIFRGDERAVETLKQIVADQEALAVRISTAILEGDGAPHKGAFSLEFTDANDLMIEYIVKLAIDYQKQDAATIAQCVEALRLAPAAQQLAEETLGLAKGHLELLEEVDKQPA